MVHAGAAEPAVYPGEQWTEVDPARQGWSAEKLKQADELARELRSAAYLVVHQGVVVRRYGDIAKPIDVAGAQEPACMRWLSARDLARVCLLVSRQGRWGDRQIMSPEWIAESTRAVTPFDHGGACAYMWWTRPSCGSVWAEGAGSQYLVINAARDLVIVHRVAHGPGRPGPPAPRSRPGCRRQGFGFAPQRPKGRCDRLELK